MWRAPTLFVACCLGAFLGACAGVEKTPQGSLPVVEARLAAPREVVVRRLYHLFGDGLARPVPGHSARGGRFACFSLFPNRPAEAGRAVTLPADVVLLAGSNGDPAIRRYVALSPGRREGDLFLAHFLDCWWPSEYVFRGRPAAFTSDFIFHLEPAAAGATRIEVLEVLPRVRLGRKLAFSAHGAGIGWVEDVRGVRPTNRERLELVAMITAAVAERDR